MSYATDLTDVQYALIADLFDVGNYGKNREHPVCHLLNAVFYLNKTGCQWRMLPNDFPPYEAVESFYRRARQSGKWDEMLTRLVENSRTHQGRTAQPTYCLIDSQSTKTAGAAKNKGIDGGKKSKRS